MFKKIENKTKSINTLYNPVLARYVPGTNWELTWYAHGTYCLSTGYVLGTYSVPTLYLSGMGKSWYLVHTADLPCDAG